MSESLAHLLQYLRFSRARSVLAANRRFWIWSLVLVLLPAMLPAVLSIWCDRETSLRLAGMWLQLLGIGTVAIGVRSIRKQFGRPGIADRVRELLVSLRWRPPTQRVELGGTGCLAATGKVRVSGDIAYGFDKSNIQGRLDALEAGQKAMSAAIRAADERISTEAAERAKALAKEEAKRTEGDAAVRKQLENVSAGGLEINAAGVWLLSCGVVLSTAPQELMWLFGL